MATTDVRLSVGDGGHCATAETTLDEESQGDSMGVLAISWHLVMSFSANFSRSASHIGCACQGWARGVGGARHGACTAASP
jgi:hypothetical protein